MSDIAATLIPRSEHIVSRKAISEQALKVLYKLHNAGYRALLVGGSVRDLLLGHTPKDFDIATDATPEQVAQLFSNCRLIGRRFRLAHIHFGRDFIEVATFRGNPTDDNTLLHPTKLKRNQHVQADHVVHKQGMILRDNVYGSLEEDAGRRDFTVNALYYDISDFSVIDYTGGVQDIASHTLRLLGDPEQRYREDPVRMLRAARFAAKLDFTIEAEAAAAIDQLGHLLDDIPAARLFDESLKLLLSGHAMQSYDLLKKYSLFGRLFPATEASLQCYPQAEAFLRQAFVNTDQRIAEGKPVTAAFLYAVLLWWPLCHELNIEPGKALPNSMKIYTKARDILQQQISITAIPKRFSIPLQEVFAIQPRLEYYSAGRALKLLGHPRFRMAYDFLCLRAAVGTTDNICAEWWTQIQLVEANEQRQMAYALSSRGKRRRKSNTEKK